MKHFNAVIEQLIHMHKDENTTYSPTKMFHSSNELSFAISRLNDAEEIFVSETLDNEEISPELRTVWFDTRDSMPKDVAQNIAVCIMKNTPLSKTSEEISSIKQMFYDVMNEFTDNRQLANAFTEIFFTSHTSQDIKKRQFKKNKCDF